ncbi:hypothetical protein QT381_02330 [Galbitalea sp. SE-J8]|uniref:hypothetical protein n=1 Tax=Galbitalea sp. SE-J8 TaxID=3054952 RepID=UPI00259C7E39|nr:hypothetical protein [Galbitalea sp. SE-J8]MDM4761842.1 hypothetical protein [Galbitalea sp. SE-J8]
MSLFARLRARLGGGPRAVAGFRPEPGPFDAPPAEPIELDESELPWELRPEPGRAGDWSGPGGLSGQGGPGGSS